MGERYYHSGKLSGFQYEDIKDPLQGKTFNNEGNKNQKDDDLIFEENTVYEIDRECYERTKKQKKR